MKKFNFNSGKLDTLFKSGRRFCMVEQSDIEHKKLVEEVKRNYHEVVEILLNECFEYITGEKIDKTKPISEDFCLHRYRSMSLIELTYKGEVVLTIEGIGIDSDPITYEEHYKSKTYEH